MNPVDKIITQLKSKYKAIRFLLQNYDYISIFKFLKNVREEILTNQKETYLEIDNMLKIPSFGSN